MPRLGVLFSSVDRGAGIHHLFAMAMRLLVLALGFCATFIWAKPLPSDDGLPAQKKMQAKVRKLLEAGRFLELEAQANDCLANQARFKDGNWKIMAWIEAVGEPADKKSSQAWERHFAQLKAWENAVSTADTSLVMTARGRALVGYAWFARGNGYANTVAQEDWALFDIRLENARKTLEAIPSEKRLPIWYGTMQTVALGQNWNRDKCAKLVADATEREPDYFYFYLGYAYYLMPRWHGNPGEWQSYALRMGKQRDGEIYARIIVDMGRRGKRSDLFNTQGIEWPVVRAGFEAMRINWPDSVWNLHLYCRMACEANDHETAAKLFEIIDNDYVEGPWGSHKFFNEKRRWALNNQK